MNVTEMLDLDDPPGLERLLAQTHAGRDALWAELENARTRFDGFACRAGLGRDVVRRFIAAGLLADAAADESAVANGLYRTSECVTVGLLLEVLERLVALESEPSRGQVSRWI